RGVEPRPLDAMVLERRAGGLPGGRQHIYGDAAITYRILEAVRDEEEDLFRGAPCSPGSGDGDRGGQLGERRRQFRVEKSNVYVGAAADCRRPSAAGVGADGDAGLIMSVGFMNREVRRVARP